MSDGYKKFTEGMDEKKNSYKWFTILGFVIAISGMVLNSVVMAFVGGFIAGVCFAMFGVTIALTKMGAEIEQMFKDLER